MRCKELYQESLKLTELVKEYKEKKYYDDLEETLLELTEVYSDLNRFKEDIYLEDMLIYYKELAQLYIIKQSIGELLETYWLTIEAYDFIIQRDIAKNKKIDKHIKGLNENYSVLKKLYKKLNVKDDIKQNFPNIAKYLH